MHLIDPQLTSSQQAFWSTLAQVNAAIIIALVVEIGLAVRQRVSDPKTVIKFLGVFGSIVIAAAYVFGAVYALRGVLGALGVLGVGRIPTDAEGESAVQSTLIALVITVAVPILRFFIWIVLLNGFMVGGAVKDFREIVASRRESRKVGISRGNKVRPPGERSAR